MLHEVIFYMYTKINIFQHFIIVANIIIYILSQMDAVTGHKNIKRFIKPYDSECNGGTRTQ